MLKTLLAPSGEFEECQEEKKRARERSLGVTALFDVTLWQGTARCSRVGLPSSSGSFRI